MASDVNLRHLDAFPELEPYLLRGARKTTDCRRLGTGSYGVVDELCVQGTMCAAKQLHESLLDPTSEGVDKVVSRFVEECRIMAGVRHPNIVQFLGLHIFPNSSYPTLVMEQLAMSLEDLLNEANKKKELFPLSLKVSILSDTAKGLAYLHNHKPQIIHRDLTSRNVLLNLAMQAKITDLGNALIIDSHTVAQTMTQTPGTAVYMPPEALHSHAKYNSTIDMFSYGHLALYTVIQEFPGVLLPATFTDEVSRDLRARSEINRRVRYMDVLHMMLGSDHLLTQIIKRCLDNIPCNRPYALQVLEDLKQLSRSTTDDIYYVFRQSSKLDLIAMVENNSRRESAVSTTRGSSPEEGIPDYLELVGGSPPATEVTACESASTLLRSEQIMVSPSMYHDPSTHFVVVHTLWLYTHRCLSIHAGVGGGNLLHVSCRHKATRVGEGMLDQY